MPSPQRKRLDSWKAIAEYLGRNVRTVTRWAEQRHLPVHRVPGGKRQSVFAYSDEIDAWLLSQRSATTDEPLSTSAPETLLANGGLSEEHPRAPATRIRKLVWVALAIAAVAGSTGWIARTLIEGRYRAAAAMPMNFVQLTYDGRAKNHLRTDGRMLYFDESEGDALSAFRVPVSGGQPRRINMPIANPLIQDVSSDGARLLVTSSEGIEMERPLWVVSTSGGLARRLGSLTCQSARWSPDSTRIACASGNSIALADSDGAHVRTVATLTSTPFNLAWVPDGKGLIFVIGNSSEPSYGSAWELSTNSQDETTVTRPVALRFGKDCCLDWAWADRGQRFLYLPFNKPPVLDEIGLPFDGSTTEKGIRQTALPVHVGNVTGFCPIAGKSLIYLLIEGPGRGELLKVGPTKTTYQVVLPGLSANDISFSRDGQWMTFVRPSDQTLWRSRADGTDVLQLTAAPVQAQLSSWSPDGHTIAYMQRTTGGPWRIFVVGKDGNGKRDVSPGGAGNQGAPSWSPDGKLIAYGDVLCQEEQTCWIHELDLRTGKLIQLPGSHGLRTARFSPDGRYIAALQPELHELVLFDTRKRTWRVLVGSVTGDNINWSRDSRFIFADSPRTNRPIIEKIRVADGHREVVADLSPLERMPGLGSPWFGLAPDGSPILLHLYNSSEIYTLDWNFH